MRPTTLQMSFCIILERSGLVPNMVGLRCFFLICSHSMRFNAEGWRATKTAQLMQTLHTQSSNKWIPAPSQIWATEFSNRLGRFTDTESNSLSHCTLVLSNIILCRSHHFAEAKSINVRFACQVCWTVTACDSSACVNNNSIIYLPQPKLISNFFSVAQTQLSRVRIPIRWKIPIKILCWKILVRIEGCSTWSV